VFVRSLLLCVLFAALPGASAPAGSTKIEYFTVAPEVIQQRLEMVQPKLADRRATLQRMFEKVGCEGERLATQPVPHSREPNVICTMPGEGEGEIVVGGHFDSIERGLGAVDDWSGVALLPSLYESLKDRTRHHRFVFIGFAAEEEGLVGSREYVKKLSRDARASIRAMVNLECFGLTPPKVWQSRADKRLLNFYSQLAAAINVPLAGVNVERVGDDDSHSFLDAKIPVITFHSVTQDTIGILHSAKDNLKAIHPDDYYAAYRLAAAYLAYLDSALE
jgi:hypothetical protein